MAMWQTPNSIFCLFFTIFLVENDQFEISGLFLIYGCLWLRSVIPLDKLISSWLELLEILCWHLACFDLCHRFQWLVLKYHSSMFSHTCGDFHLKSRLFVSQMYSTFTSRMCQSLCKLNRWNSNIQITRQAYIIDWQLGIGCETFK